MKTYGFSKRFKQAITASLMTQTAQDTGSGYSLHASSMKPVLASTCIAGKRAKEHMDEKKNYKDKL